MAEYIERDALRDAVESIDWYSVYKGKLTAGAPSSANALYKANEIYSAIDNAPAVDVVTVVRCKDCKYGEVDDTDFPAQYLCKYNGADWNDENHFCSYGEQKEGAD